GRGSDRRLLPVAAGDRAASGAAGPPRLRAPALLQEGGGGGRGPHRPGGGCGAVARQARFVPHSGPIQPVGTEVGRLRPTPFDLRRDGPRGTGGGVPSRPTFHPPGRCTPPGG